MKSVPAGAGKAGTMPALAWRASKAHSKGIISAPREAAAAGAAAAAGTGKFRRHRHRYPNHQQYVVCVVPEPVPYC